MGGDMNWVKKQFIEELKNEWSDFTFEMLLATAEEEANVSSEEWKGHTGSHSRTLILSFSTSMYRRVWIGNHANRLSTLE